MNFSAEVYEAALAKNPRSAAQYKGRCRGACAKAGVPVPAWAALRSDETPGKPAATRAERALTARVESFLQLPAELVAWRAAASARVVAVSTEAVRLIALDFGGRRREAAFESIELAAAALATPESIRWIAKRKPKADPRARSNRVINA